MNPSAQPGLLGKLVGFVAMTVMLALGLMFSVALLAGALVIGLGAFGYFWWKTRDMRKMMREQSAKRASGDGAVIEGEAVIVEDEARTGETLLIVESRERQP